MARAAATPDLELLRDAMIQDEQITEEGGKYTITELCCGKTATQFPPRMAYCEDKAHTAVALAAKAASMGGLNVNSSLDGIVKITHESKPFPVLGTETVAYLGSKDSGGGEDGEYISDHNGINVHISETEPGYQLNFNILSYNLEGICYRLDHPESFPERLAKYDQHFALRYKASPSLHPRRTVNDGRNSFISRGIIMPLQEIALQLYTMDFTNPTKYLRKQRRALRSNIHEIMSIFSHHNIHLKYSVDDYTGGIIYDYSVWDLVQTVTVSRFVKGVKTNKKSTAYLFHHNPIARSLSGSLRGERVPKEDGLRIWVVNVHLKAFATGKQKDINDVHIEELANIIYNVNVNNVEKYPVYICGDFNNNSNKDILVSVAWNKARKIKYTQLHEGKAEQDPDGFVVM